jgi:predicted O-linked N-acetylglucosamine transferase (SPINDLY family)
MHLGNILMAMKCFEEAQFSYERSTALDPDYADAHCNLAQALLWQRKFEACLPVVNRAVRLSPNMTEALFTKGNCLFLSGNFKEAAEAFRLTVATAPQHLEALMGLGIAYSNLFQFDNAIAVFNQVVENAPDTFEAYSNLGVMYQMKGQAKKALESLTLALAINENDAVSHLNKGISHLLLCDMPNAEESFDRAIALDPDNYNAMGNKLYMACLDKAHIAGSYIEQAKKYGATVAQWASPYAEWPAADAFAQQSGKIRVGLVSGDLRQHSVGFFVEGFVKSLDPSKVHLVAFYNNPVEDHITARVKPFFAEWHQIYGLKDPELAKKIHDEGIQILIDISGHTASNRLPMFAFKPAPVQVSWLGFLASTGVKEIDYFLADPISAPPECQADFTEKIWHLPHTINCLAEPQTISPVAVSVLPALIKGHVTFGCFQNRAKINVEVQQTWREILQAIPKSQLLIICRNIGTEADRLVFLQELEQNGLPVDRITLKGALSHRDDLLRSYQLVDISLDPFPYPGVTTTCESLWMGVPVLTLAGKTLLERQGASLMSAVGLTDWIAHDRAQYVDIAIQQVRHIDKLAELRAKLRQQALASPVFDTALFAKHWTQAMQQMWAQYLQAKRNQVI